MVKPNYYNLFDWTIQTREVIWYNFTQWNCTSQVSFLFTALSHWYPHIICNNQLYSSYLIWVCRISTNMYNRTWVSFAFSAKQNQNHSHSCDILCNSFNSNRQRECAYRLKYFYRILNFKTSHKLGQTSWKRMLT